MRLFKLIRQYFCSHLNQQSETNEERRSGRTFGVSYFRCVDCGAISGNKFWFELNDVTLQEQKAQEKLKEKESE